VTDAEVRAAQERAERATKGRWECVDGNSPHPDWAAYVVDDSPSDWDFVRNARTDVPALCRDLLAAREALRGCAVCSGCHERCERYNAALGEEVRP